MDEITVLENLGYKEGDYVPNKGVLLPDGTFSQRSLPGSSTDTTPTVSTSTGTVAQTTPFDDLIAKATAAANPFLAQENNSTTKLAEITSLEQTKNLEARKAIESKYAQKIKSEEDQGASDVATRTAQLGRVGGSGDVRFSSAAIGFIDSAVKSSKKRISELDLAREEALAKADIEMAKNLQDLKIKELERQDKLENEKFDRMLQLIDVGFKREEFLKDSASSEQKLDLDIIDTLRGIPAGQSITVNGRVYQGLGSNKDTELVKEEVIEDGRKVAKIYLLDKTTGNVLSSKTLGQTESGLSSVTNTSGQKYSSRLDSEISNVYGGYYGTASEAAITTAAQILQREYPNVDPLQIQADLRSRVPDAAQIKPRSTDYTGTSIPPQTQKELIADIKANAPLSELYQLYPDVSASYIQSLYYNR